MGRPPTKKTEYQKALDGLKLTQFEASEFLEIGERTSRRYASMKKLPTPIALLLALMLKYKLSPDDARKIANR
jgi:hypothetical protein